MRGEVRKETTKKDMDFYDLELLYCQNKYTPSPSVKFQFSLCLYKSREREREREDIANR